MNSHIHTYSRQLRYCAKNVCLHASFKLCVNFQKTQYLVTYTTMELTVPVCQKKKGLDKVKISSYAHSICFIWSHTMCSCNLARTLLVHTDCHINYVFGLAKRANPNPHRPHFPHAPETNQNLKS